MVSIKQTLNLIKTNFVIFRPYQKPLPFLPTIYINDHITNSLTHLESKDHGKYLGVHIDYKLSWKNHIDSITIKLSKTIGLLSKIRHFPCSLVVPYLRYGLIAWGQTGFADRCDHAIPLFLRAQTLPIHFLYYKLLAETMHDVSNDVIPSQLKDLFIPTVKIHSYNTRYSVSDNFYIKKSNLEVKRKSFSVIGAKLWNEIPKKLRTLPKLIFKRKIRMILFNILESEDSYEDLESIISKVRKYS